MSPRNGAISRSSAIVTGRFPRNARDLPPASTSRSINSSPSSTGAPALLQKFQQCGVSGNLENGRHAGPLGIRTHHIGRGAPSQNQRKCIHYNGFAASGLARQQVQSGVKPHPDALHHGVVLDHQLQQHSMKLYEVSVRLTEQ